MTELWVETQDSAVTLLPLLCSCIDTLSPTPLSSPFCLTFTPLGSRFHQASYFAYILCSLGAQTHLPLMLKHLRCEEESTAIKNLKGKDDKIFGEE